MSRALQFFWISNAAAASPLKPPQQLPRVVAICRHRQPWIV